MPKEWYLSDVILGREVELGERREVSLDPGHNMSRCAEAWECGLEENWYLLQICYMFLGTKRQTRHICYFSLVLILQLKKWKFKEISST